MTSEFRNSFGENIFRLKYAASPSETWYQRAITIVEDVCGPLHKHGGQLMSKDDRDTLAQYIREFKFVPGGRYIYYAGRNAKFFNNCFSGDETFITKEGVKSFEETAGIPQKVLDPITKDFVDAEIRHFGKQQVYRMLFKNIRGRSNKVLEKYVTEDHRWILKNGDETTNLKLGDVIPAVGYESNVNIDAFIHGLIFADGNVQELKNGYAHQLRLCGKKSKWVDILAEYGTVTYPPFAKGDPVVYIKSSSNLKNLPISINPDYIGNFLKGWIELDGYKGAVRQLHSINEEAINYFEKYAYTANYVTTGEILVDTTPSNFGERSPLYRVNFKETDDFPGFKLFSKDKMGIEDVYCAIVPSSGQFTLSGGLRTGNCYLLRAEEDTREEWGALTERATSCLMTGGGIGASYSRLREEGRILSRTGGTSSGPLPLMNILNEAGRNVMQGGSRRSAIYASLAESHPDIHKFLHVKDWDKIIVAPGVTLADVKRDNFNFPAPLDMTNISVEWGDRWGGRTHEARAKDPIFLENCFQAMKTGEPGFSFNFLEQSEEVLRNACTEVTSEDDSDVCNLSSVNMGAIDSLEEFKDIITLGSKFLVCGTLRAELPYQKVYDVREKNRRLGLGLMGVHEWLLKRGKEYEVDGEMKKWLEVYEQESEISAIEHCDRLYLSTPKAFRAIAPTGSIGIMAGTTTGIEPLYAVAYKRRYLTEGTKWKYEYVVDSTAESLIQEYEIDPDSIQTSMSLAEDVEKRIKFQADIQEYVDMSISSTINLPRWGSKLNNESKVEDFASILAWYAPRLRGLTCYPDGARGGQPLTAMPYSDAMKHKGVVFEENDICDISGHGGSCGS